MKIEVSSKGRGFVVYLQKGKGNLSFSWHRLPQEPKRWIAQNEDARRPHPGHTDNRRHNPVGVAEAVELQRNMQHAFQREALISRAIGRFK